MGSVWTETGVRAGHTRRRCPGVRPYARPRSAGAAATVRLGAGEGRRPRARPGRARVMHAVDWVSPLAWVTARPPPSVIAVASGSSRPIRASMSLASQACLKSLTTATRWASEVVGDCAALMRRRAEEANWRHAAGIRPTTSATSANEWQKTSCSMKATRSAGVIDSSTTRKARLTDSSRVTRSAGSASAPAARPLIHSQLSGQWLRDPFAHVGLSSGPCRAEQVEADATGDCRQPGAGVLDGVLLLP